MVGDFNTVLNTSIDGKGNHTTIYHSQAIKEILNVIDILELVDIWRLKYPDLVRYTVHGGGFIKLVILITFLCHSLWHQKFKKC